MIVIISQLRCFLTFAGQSFNILIVLRASGLKATSSEGYLVEQWTGNPKAAGSIPVGRQFFALLVLSSRRSGGSSLGFRAGSL